MMETVTFKLSEDILKKVDSLLKPLHFSNRTEFLRECVREKIFDVENDHVMRALLKFKGSAKKYVSDEELHKIREEVAKKYAEKAGITL